MYLCPPFNCHSVALNTYYIIYCIILIFVWECICDVNVLVICPSIAPDSIVESKVGEQKPISAPEVGDPELRRRRSLLAALERIGRAEEEEEKEEEFQLPQREADSGFSVNKCILGALILLGLGTIFFSGRHLRRSCSK